MHFPNSLITGSRPYFDKPWVVWIPVVTTGDVILVITVVTIGVDVSISADTNKDKQKNVFTIKL